MEEALVDLRLEDEEGNGEIEGWEIDQVNDPLEETSYLCLVGCFLTTIIVTFQSMKIVLANLWHPLGSKELPLGWNISLKAPSQKATIGGSVRLREPSENWGVNLGESREDIGKSNININFSKFIHNARSNLGINRAGKSKLPNTDEEVSDLMDVGMLNEDMPMNVMDGKKKRLRLYDVSLVPRAQELIIALEIWKEDCLNDQMVELVKQEKQGERCREERPMRDFQDALDRCGLIDMGYPGRWYTWEKGNFASNNIIERLDRGVANSSWHKINRIKGLKDENEIMRKEEAEMLRVAVRYFKGIFETSGRNNENEIYEGVSKSVT
ncbi:hypothetical protein GOBAR_AA05545 [Gossypium barbadense]|uniref:DUF4283 domain-containing protein n=1 Tax=Gossypium barbadense TaxID=3634 RepID=A0A2P5YHH6_GOSBA|nr:hypothetical protein GOBAR_AA05545 [Gossypium barbadense]